MTTPSGTAAAGPMRVCFALPRLLPDKEGILVGGSANAALTLGQAMARCGTQLKILAPVPLDRVGALAGHPACALVTPLSYPKSGSLGIFEGLRSLALLVKALRQRQAEFDIIHSHSGTFPYSLVSLACRRAGARVHSLYCPLGGQGGAYGHWWDQKAVARAMLHRLDAVVAVSENVRHSIETAGVSGQTVSLLPMSVDMARFHPRPCPIDESSKHFTADSRGRRLLFVGNASKEKGLRNLVEAVGILASQDVRPSVVATLENANSVEEYEQEFRLVKTRVTALGLDAQIRFLGLVRDMPALYAEADVVVIPWVTTRGPSDLPMVALEAMAMGKCVVSTPVGGCSELLKGGSAGLLTTDFSPESLARTLTDALESASLRRKIGDAAMAVADEYSAETLARKMIALYRDILNRKRIHTR